MISVLITNDDGIAAPGIRKLAEIVSQFARVTIVAPDSQRSAASHSWSWLKPITAKPYDFGMDGVTTYACSGTPTDCVKLGVLKLLPEKPDFVLSGINKGPNISADIQYSGTVGAALEGDFLGVHSIAVSLESGEEDYSLVDVYLKDLLEECMAQPLPAGQVWNINFPTANVEECQGILRDAKVCKDPFYVDTYLEKELADGATEYTLKYGRVLDPSEGTDLYAMTHKMIAVGKVTNIN